MKESLSIPRMCAFTGGDSRERWCHARFSGVPLPFSPQGGSWCGGASCVVVFRENWKKSNQKCKLLDLGGLPFTLSIYLYTQT